MVMFTGAQGAEGAGEQSPLTGSPGVAVMAPGRRNAQKKGQWRPGSTGCECGTGLPGIQRSQSVGGLGAGCSGTS